MPLGMQGFDDPHLTMRPNVQITSSPFELQNQLILTDRLLSFDITATKDEAVSRATFTFSMGRGADSLSPGVINSSYIVGGRAALEPGHWIGLFIERNGVLAGQLWYGRIDRVNAAAGRDTVSVTCRDFGAVALNGVLRAAVNLEGTIGILNRIREISTTAVTQGSHVDGLTFRIIEPVATNWITNPLHPQHEMTVMEASRQMVQTFGGDFRVRGSHGWDKLCILAPQRSASFDIHNNRWITDATIGPARYSDITELTWGDEDVRNQWDGYYADPVTGLPVGPTYVEDVTSIASFGPRYARVFLDRVYNIDTAGEMTNFLNAALADSKEPFASHRITMPFYPDVELDDTHTYLSNDAEYDTSLYLAVVAYSHHWESTPGVMPTTTIGARGNRIGAYREYRRSVPPKTIVTTIAPTTQYAPEGTVILVRAV